MRFMVIETFLDQAARSIYRRLRDSGRQMPEGLTYIDSWVSADLGRSFQLMETEDLSQLQRWIAAWSDLMAFEVVPVISGAETAAGLQGQLD